MANTGAKGGISIRGFAKAVGVSHPAVLKGIKGGRLRASIVLDAAGRPSIQDLALAKREWADSASRLPRLVTTVTASEPVTDPPPAADAAEDDAEIDSPDGIIHATTLADAQRIATLERAKSLRLARDIRTGRLVEKAAVVKLQFEATRIIREGVLNVPARLSAELAAETDPSRVHIKLEAALRDALQEVANRLDEAASA